MVDYLITPHKTLQNILEFRVGDFHPLLSDHCPIMATIHLNNPIKQDEEQQIQLLKLPNKFQWDSDSTVAFSETLASDECKEKVQELLEKKDLQVEDIKRLLMDTANVSQIRRSQNSKFKKSDKPWFDKECCDLKKEVNSCGKNMRKQPSDANNREKMYILKKKLRNTVRRKKNEFQKAIVDDMCSDLSNKQQKDYWNGLRKLERQKDEQKYIPDFTLISHFNELLFDDRIDLKFDKQSKMEGVLDYPISLEELKRATKILKAGKGVGIDVVLNEMLTPPGQFTPKTCFKSF